MGRSRMEPMEVRGTDFENVSFGTIGNSFEKTDDILITLEV